MSIEIYPSLISSNLLQLGQTLQQLDPHVDGYHIDIMDDHFVPNLTWGYRFVELLQKATDRPLHIHLMVDNPIRWIDRVTIRQQDVLVPHIEAFRDHDRIDSFMLRAREKKASVGLALCPSTPVSKLTPHLQGIHQVLIMSVNPGFSGQEFLPETLDKMPPLKQALAEANPSCKIAMDGGINVQNLTLIAQAGVTQIGVANAVFGGQEPIAAIQQLRAAIR